MTRICLAPRILTATVGLVVAGCDSSITAPEHDPGSPPDVRPYVTGLALENLSSRGHFRMPPATVEAPYQSISGGQAEQLALGIIRTWYANPNVQTIPGTGSLKEAAEHGHGGPIEWGRVRLGARSPHFAESHLEPLPEEMGPATIRHFGPRFLVPLYVDATPVVSVSIAAYATNLYLDEQGFVRRTDNLSGGGEFRVAGIPLVLDGITLPPDPEVAVRFASEQTGVRVSEVPILGVPGNRVFSLASRWRLKLEHPVAFERAVDGEVVLEDEVYVGVLPSITDARQDEGSISPTPGLRLFVRAGNQPAFEPLESFNAPLRPGYAVDLHEVRVWP